MVGSASAPKKELIGEAGTKELMQVKQEGETGLAAFFKTGKASALETFGTDGLPPLPSGANLKPDMDKYNLTAEQAYPEK